MKKKQKYQMCSHALSIGEKVVFTDPGCPKATLGLGTFVCSKKACKRCKNNAVKMRSANREKKEAA